VLCRLPVTPNQVTLGAGLVGLAGAALLAVGQPLLLLAGLVLAHLQSILDGCDGELARVRFQLSRLGAWLDTLVDDLLNVALIAGLGVGLGRQGVSWAPAVGIGAAGLLLFHDAIAYRELVRQGVGGDLFRLRWWFAAGRELRDVYATRRGPVSALLLLGRRDFVLVAWIGLALADALPLALLHAGALAVAAAVAAAGQLVHGAPPAAGSGKAQPR
jgi:phosphatidylglycerophosphate synthase